MSERARATRPTRATSLRAKRFPEMAAARHFVGCARAWFRRSGAVDSRRMPRTRMPMECCNQLIDKAVRQIVNKAWYAYLTSRIHVLLFDYLFLKILYLLYWNLVGTTELLCINLLMFFCFLVLDIFWLL